jgi:hypothetical protein
MYGMCWNGKVPPLFLMVVLYMILYLRILVAVAVDFFSGIVMVEVN